MCDEHGLIYAGRKGLDRYRSRFAQPGKARALPEVLQGADVLVGLSVGGIVCCEMLKAMAKRPIVFALANPNPEITPEEARAARPDAIIATGRSDYPNQVNNVLGFPFIFRGALDVRAKKINEDMEMAATRALAALAKEEVPDSVMRAYGLGASGSAWTTSFPSRSIPASSCGSPRQSRGRRSAPVSRDA